MPLETRQSYRRPLSVIVRLFKGQKFLSRIARGLDISDNGMRLATPIPVEKGMRLGMTFSLPGDSRRERVDGKVVWRAAHSDADCPFQCGILFDNLKKTAAADEKPLYFMGDRMCDFILKMTPQDLVARPASSLTEIKKAFKLIYKEYISLGYCKPNDARMHYSAYVFLPGSRTFILKKKRHFLGTVSLVEDSLRGIPMEKTFPDLIPELRKKGGKIAEVSLLTLDREAFKKSRFTLTDSHKLTGSFWLFKSMLDYARLAAGVTDLLITVHPKHEKLYRNFAFSPLGKPASYDGAEGNPGLPMHLDVTRLERNLPKEKSFRKFFFDDSKLRKKPGRSFEWTTEDIYNFLLETKLPSSL